MRCALYRRLPSYCCKLFTATDSSLSVLIRKLYTMSNGEAGVKRPCLDSDVMKVIGTHNGTFHCDEVLACFMLKTLDEYRDARIVRTRDQEKLDKCDIVVDVGGVYDPTRHRYDHHQKTFDGSMQTLTDGGKPWVTKLSSAGLVYLHFGHRIIAGMAGTAQESEVNEELYDKMYEVFVEEIDAVDNGIERSDGPKKYKVTTTISNRVSYLNPGWNSKGENPDELFVKAMDMVGSEFKDRLLYLVKRWLPAREIVQKTFQDRHKVHDSGAILHLETGCPWKEHLFEIEKANGVEEAIKFILYQDQNDQYRVQAVPVTSQSFTSRLGLPQRWRGLRGEELCRESGIDGCVFVHMSGFIGGNLTYDGALEMAVRTLNCDSVN